MMGRHKVELISESYVTDVPPVYLPGGLVMNLRVSLTILG